MLGVTGLLGDFLVRERCDKVRALLAVEGCHVTAYWTGTFLADYGLLSIGTLVRLLSPLYSSISDG